MRCSFFLEGGVGGGRGEEGEVHEYKQQFESLTVPNATLLSTLDCKLVYKKAKTRKENSMKPGLGSIC